MTDLEEYIFYFMVGVCLGVLYLIIRLILNYSLNVIKNRVRPQTVTVSLTPTPLPSVDTVTVDDITYGVGFIMVMVGVMSYLPLKRLIMVMLCIFLIDILMLTSNYLGSVSLHLSRGGVLSCTTTGY